MSLLGNLGLRTKQQRAWALYDWGNSAFPTIMMTAILPIYFADVLAKDLPEHLRTAYWGYTSAVAMTIIALLAPILGAFGDIMSLKKPFIVLGAIIGIIFSGMLATLEGGDWMLAAIFFILGNIGFAIAEIFYDALLPSIAKPHEVTRVSTAGFAVGYLGGGLCLLICLAMIKAPATFGLEDAGEGVRSSFLVVAAWWGIFTIPILRWVPEPIKTSKRKLPHLLAPLKKNIDTLKKLRLHKNAFLFLLAFWAYSDGIGTVIKMAAIYGKEVGIGTADLIGAILMVQFLGVIFTFAFGAIADRIGNKPSLYVTLIIYSIICIMAYYLTEGWQFWILAFLVSLAQGPAQALSRALFISLIPKDQAGEFFGFFSVSARFAGIFGPLLFGLVSQFLGSSRQSILAIIVLFIVGIVVLMKVETPNSAKEA